MKYQLYARYIPSILSAIPALLFQYFFLNSEISSFLNFLGGFSFAGDLTISVAILFFFSETNRFIAKKFFERDEIFLPTTNFLLFSDSEYSSEHKNRIYDKIRNDFSVHLPSKEEQILNETNSRQRISEAVSLIRGKVGQGSLLLKHNIQYGFWRNLIGGAIISGLFSLVDIIFAYYQFNIAILVLSSFLLLCNLFLLTFNKFIIDDVGKWYARKLIQEYLGS